MGIIEIIYSDEEINKVLKRVKRNTDSTAEDIALDTGICEPAVENILTRLMKAGLVGSHRSVSVGFI